MAIIVLFIISSLLVFLKLEPFTTAGYLLIICYLPGLSLFSLSKQEKISFKDLILSFPCSIGLSSIFIIGFLSLDIRVNYIPVIIHVIIGVVVIIHAFIRKKNKAFARIEIKKEELLFSFFALVIILLVILPFLSGPDRLLYSAHGFHHSFLVTQIMNGIFPPENPGLGGTPIGYYWGFHALIAALTVKTNFQQIQIMFLLNIISLYAIFCISYSFAKFFDFTEPYRYILPLAIMGLMRADAGILFLVKLCSGNLVSLEQLTASPIEPFDILSHWISGLSWIDTRLFFLNKLYNVSGMLLALSLCYAYLLILLKREFFTNKIDRLVIALIISACFFNYPPLAIFLLLHAPLLSCYIFLSSHGDLKEKIGQASNILIPYIIAVLIVSPYMLYVTVSRNISSGGQGELISFDFYDQSLKNMVVFMIPLPIIAYGAWVSLKKLSLSKEFFLLAIGTVLCLTLTVFTRWPFDNSYKFDYILLFFFSLFFLFALAGLSTYIKGNWLKLIYLTIIILFLLLTPLIVISSDVISSFSRDYIYSFTGRHIIYAKDKQKNGAYTWIRENTPHDALLMLTYIETNWPCCGLQSNYEAAAISERTLYAIKDKDYTVSNPEYARRVLFRKKLFDNPDDQSVIDYFSEINRPIYLLIEENLDESRFFVEDRFKPFTYNHRKRFVLLYHNEKQWVYHVQLSK